MNEIALYRKYRPQNFKDVLGQENIVKVLEGSIALGNISHSYLFAGSRGTGKTSIARIFAKAIGCSDNDLYEIDAASNRGIDDIREIREAVSTLPFESPYKVYIIDEVHMLTKEAFNALLKTLEEPPKHIVFILATTEIEKLPETVVSRCQVFTFKKPSQKILKELVLNLAKKEGFKIESSSADLIALLGEGSFRDTQGILQKILSFSKDKKISAEEVEQVAGAPRASLVNDFIKSLDDKNLSKGLEAIKSAISNNIDILVYLKLILRKMRAIILLKYAPNMERETKEEYSEEDFNFLKELSVEKESNINSKILLEMLAAYDSVARANIPELPLELALIKIAS